MKYLIMLVAGALAFTGCTRADDGQSAEPSAISMTVYKSPTCGCCGEWIEHIEDKGFTAAVQHPQDLSAVKQSLGLKPEYASCHTGVTKDGYVFEGHIPAKTIQEFLSNPPKDALGLAVPGMPIGSPGMEVDDRFSPYSVLLLKKDGGSEEYRRFASAEEQF